MAGWRPAYEAPTTYDYHGWTVCKTQPWGQGPVMLQALSLLKGFDVAALDPGGADFAHLVLEASKLAFADREAYYGDPNFVDVPMDALLSEPYAAARRALIGETASHEIQPGILSGFEDQVARALGMVRPSTDVAGGLGIGEPTMAHLKVTVKPGDTVHLDVIDRWGNMVSATPSGGWPQSSPTIPGLGFALNTRAQMFWLEPGLPSSLAPGKRPRTTLTPTLALQDGRPRLICGTPGGDQQDQWQLVLLLRRIHHGIGLQQAIDMPLFHTVHFPSSFYPRQALPGVSVIEESVGEGGDDGVLRAAATPRLMQAYAVGR